MVLLKRSLILFTRGNFGRFAKLTLVKAINTIATSLESAVKASWSLPYQMPGKMAMSLDTIREKFESSDYLNRVPNLLEMNSEGVYMHLNAPYFDVIDAIQNSVRDVHKKDNVLTPKLKASRYDDDWDFRAQMLPANYFKSRDCFEELILEKEWREVGTQCINVSRISIRDAIKNMKVDIACDMKYYLENMKEMETDLNCTIPSSLDLNNKLVVKKLEQELFYKNMCKVFGKESADDEVEVDGEETLYDKSFMIKDFSILSHDGQSITATAVRDDYYLLLFFNS